MRRVFWDLRSCAVALYAGAVFFVPACKGIPGFARSDAGPGASASPADAGAPPAGSAAEADAAPSTGLEPSADAATAPPGHAPASHPVGPPAAGNACAPKDPKEATACAPGGFEELTCTGGVWKVSETCRGPGGCKSDAAGVHCDPGVARPGDACPAAAPPHCSNVHTVFICKNGAWESSLCVPPAKCVANAKNGVAGCK